MAARRTKNGPQRRQPQEAQVTNNRLHPYYTWGFGGLQVSTLKTHYPGSQVRITAPFFTLACKCGFRTWSLLGGGGLHRVPTAGGLWQKKVIRNVLQRDRT